MQTTFPQQNNLTAQKYCHIIIIESASITHFNYIYVFTIECLYYTVYIGSRYTLIECMNM